MRKPPATLQEYMQFLNDTYEPGPFQPSVYYNRPGEQLEVWWSDEPAYAEQVGNLFAVQRSQETGNAVGLTLYGPKHVMRQESLLCRNDPHKIAEHEERLRKWMERP